MNVVPIEAGVAVLFGLGLVLLVFALGRPRASAGTTSKSRKAKAPSGPVINFAKRPSSSKLVIQHLHPFAWDIRTIIAGVLILVSALMHLWLLIPLSAIDGYLFGEMFLPADITAMADSLRDAMLFITQVASSLGIGNSSLGDVVIESITSLPQSSAFRQEREGVYRTLVSMQIDTENDDADSNATRLLAALFANDSLTELRAIDELVYSSLTNTQWRLRDQLNSLSDDLSRRLRGLNDVLTSQLMPAVGSERIITIVSILMSFGTILLYGASSQIANNFGYNVLVSLTIGGTLFLTAYLTLRAQLRLFSPTLFL